MKVIMPFFAVLFMFSTAVHAKTLTCKQRYGDGVDVNLVLKASDKVNAETVAYEDLDKKRLPFLGKHDGWIPYREVSISGFDLAPSKTVTGYSIGDFDLEKTGFVSIIDSKGTSIGALYVLGSDINVWVWGLTDMWTTCK